MSCILLMRAGSSSSNSGGGGGVAAQNEIQDLLFTALGSYAVNLFGKFTFTWNGNSTLLDFSVGMSPINNDLLKDILAADVYGVNAELASNVNVSTAPAGTGYRLEFVNDLAAQDIDEATITPDTNWPLNDGTGSAPSKISQNDYVPNVQEVVVLDLYINDPESTGYVSDSNGNAISYDPSGPSYTTQPAPGWTNTAGTNSSNATFTADSYGPKNTVLNVNNNNGSGSPVTVSTAGLTEFYAAVTVDFGTGTAGWIDYQAADLSGGSVRLFPTMTELQIISALQAGGYGAISVSKGGTYFNVTSQTSFVSLAAVSVTGKCGIASVAAITTVQGGG